VALEVTGELAIAADMATTFTTVDHCGETNPVIGRCGGRVPVTVFFPLVMLVHVGVSVLLPHGWWRTTFQGLTAGGEAHAAYINYVVHRQHGESL
jgi:hypothetical protein